MPYPIRGMASFFFLSFILNTVLQKIFRSDVGTVCPKDSAVYAVSDKPALIENKSIIYKPFLNITMVEGIPYH